MKRIALLGATGSIGQDTLALVRQAPDEYRVVALSGWNNAERVAALAREFRPDLVAVGTGAAARRIAREVPAAVVVGEEGLVQVATHPEAEVVVGAIVGSPGFLPTFRAVEAGKTVALANKEALVVAGELLMAAARTAGAAVIPIDSEHNAVDQCLRGEDRAAVRRIVLTASGGALRDRPRETLGSVTPEEALRHPTWEMGRKITIDSATLMNKGFEVIEAHHLFGLPPEQIDVVIHPQSLIHSLVEFCDGSFKAQLGCNDMRFPIHYALQAPRRRPLALPPLDLLTLGALEFRPVDPARYPCLALAYRALDLGGAAPALLAGADEAVVEAFLDRRLPFDRIAAVLEEVLAGALPPPPADVAAAVAASRAGYERARDLVERV